MQSSQKRTKKTLGYQLIAPFVIGALCLIIFIVGYTYRSAYTAVKNAMLNISSARTDNTIDSISILMKSLRSRAQDLLIDPGIMAFLLEYDKKENSRDYPADWEDFAFRTSRRLEIMTEGYRYFRDILILDKNAMCIASSNESYLGMNYSEEEYVQQALTGRYYLGNFSIGKVSKNFSAYFSAPIDINGTLDGILVIISDSPHIIQYDLQRKFLSRAISTSIISPDGFYMAHKDINIMGNKDMDYTSVYEKLFLVGERGDAVEYVQGGKQYVGFARVEPNTQWVVVTSGLNSDIFASAYNTGVVVFIVSSLFLCIVSILVIRYTSSIFNTLIDLIRYAKNVSEGHLDMPLEPTTRTDELGVLHNSLENLVVTLRSMLQERHNADRSKDEFLANMSHEIRTPLNAVLGMAHLAEQEDATPEKRKLYLNRIKFAAQSLLGIINDILDISKVEAGKMTIESNVFELKEMLEETLVIHNEAVDSKNLLLSVDCASNVHPYYIGDVLRIRQILNNLLSNAIKFTKQGEIKLFCKEENAGGVGNRVRLYFSVSDTGTGIPQDMIPKLFQPFTQADASVTRKFGGTGLGLAISRRLVLMMEGDIWMESVVNEGTTFTFYITLPIAEDAKVEENILPEHELISTDSIVDISNKNILLAEDNDINQMIFKELLAPFGSQIVSVTDGEQAVEAFKNKFFDVILMDIQMPVMGGLEATKKIRSMEKGNDCFIIALTANARSQDKIEAFDVGMDDYMTKPVDPPLFTKTVKKWLLTSV